MSADRFDHRDPEVEALMVDRSMAQAIAIGSAHPLDVDGALVACYPDEYREAGPRRATSDVAEMRRRHHERDDPLDVDPPPSWTAGQVTLDWTYLIEPQQSYARWAGTAERLERLTADERVWVEEMTRTTPLSLEQAVSAVHARATLEKMMAIFNDLCANVQPAFDALATWAEQESVASRSERRRHGHASVCPRHGPTRGGLCRRCSR